MVLLDPGDPLQFVKEPQVWSVTAQLRSGRLWEPRVEPVLSPSKETHMPGGDLSFGKNPPAIRLPRDHAAVLRLTRIPALVARVISISRLNLSHLPLVRSETLD
jgi:hypothetical protein